MNNSSLTWAIIESLFELSWFKLGEPCQLKLAYSGDLRVGMRTTKLGIFVGGEDISL